MARTKQTARLSTGGKAPRRPVIPKQTARQSTGGKAPRRPVIPKPKGRKNPFVKEKGVCYYLPLLVEGECLNTELDTCAANCVISYAALQHIIGKIKGKGSGLDEDRYGSFVIACEEEPTSEIIFVSLAGMGVRSEGSVTLQCAFLDDTTKLTEITMQVCSSLPDGISLVLSSSYIEDFNLFSDNSWRLTPRQDHTQVHPPRIMRMAPARTQLPIYLGSYKINACADTGANLNVISLEFSQRCRKTMHDLNDSDPQYVEFFDRTQAPVLGKVFAKIFFQAQKSLNSEPEEAVTKRLVHTQKKVPMTTLFVLSNIISEVTLGAEFLDSIGAFTQNARKLQHVSDKQRFAVIRKSHKRKHEATEDAHPLNLHELNAAKHRLLGVKTDRQQGIEKDIEYLQRQIASTPIGDPVITTIQTELNLKRHELTGLEQTFQLDLQSITNNYNQHIASTSVSPPSAISQSAYTPSTNVLPSPITDTEKANSIQQEWQHKWKPQCQQLLDDPPLDLNERKRKYLKLLEDVQTNVVQPGKKLRGLPLLRAQSIWGQTKNDVEGVLQSLKLDNRY